MVLDLEPINEEPRYYSGYRDKRETLEPIKTES